MTSGRRARWARLENDAQRGIKACLQTLDLRACAVAGERGLRRRHRVVPYSEQNVEATPTITTAAVAASTATFTLCGR